MSASGDERLESPYFGQDEGGCLNGVLEREGMQFEYHRIAPDSTVTCVRVPDGAPPERILREPDGATSLLLNRHDGGPQHPSKLLWARSGALPVLLRTGRSFDYVLADVDERGVLAMMMREAQPHGADLMAGTADRAGPVSFRVLDRDRTEKTCRHMPYDAKGPERDECTSRETKHYPVAMHAGPQGARFAYERQLIDAREVCTMHLTPCDPGPDPDSCRNNPPRRNCQRTDLGMQGRLFVTDGSGYTAAVLDRGAQASAIGFDADGLLHVVLGESPSAPAAGTELRHLIIGPSP